MDKCNPRFHTNLLSLLSLNIIIIILI